MSLNLGMCMHEVQLARMVFDQRRTVFDPVTCVAVRDAVLLMHLRGMNMSTNDAVAKSMACVSGQAAFEALDMMLND